MPIGGGLCFERRKDGLPLEASLSRDHPDPHSEAVLRVDFLRNELHRFKHLLVAPVIAHRQNEDVIPRIVILSQSVRMSEPQQRGHALHQRHKAMFSRNPSKIS